MYQFIYTHVDICMLVFFHTYDKFSIFICHAKGLLPVNNMKAGQIYQWPVIAWHMSLLLHARMLLSYPGVTAVPLPQS